MIEADIGRLWHRISENDDVSYVDDPFLRQANLFLVPKQIAISRLLASDSQFNLIYEDSLAIGVRQGAKRRQLPRIVDST